MRNLFWARFAGVLLIAGLVLLIFGTLIKASLLHPILLFGLALIAAAGMLVWRGVGSLREVDFVNLLTAHPHADFPSTFASTFVLIALFLMCLFMWTSLLGGGLFSVRVYDWRYLYQYFDLIKQALETSQVPYFAAASLGTMQESNRFLAIPEVLSSPQVLLLRWMDIRTFIVFDTLLMVTIGYVGCLMFWRRWRLSPISFTFLVLAFFLNGYITSRFASGQFAWLGYFVSPFLVDAIFRLIEGRSKAAIGLGVALFLMGLQGAIHMMIWWLILLGLIALWRRDLWIPILAAIMIALSLYTFRLLPTAIAYQDYYPAFTGGYRSVEHVLEAFVFTHDHFYVPSTNVLSWWEYDMYLGGVGTALLLFFGLYIRHQRQDVPAWNTLNWPMIILALLSMGYVYSVLRMLPIPLIASQRVTSRLLSVPVILLIFMAAITMQRWLENHPQRRIPTIALVIALLLMSVDLYQHLLYWALPRIDMFLGSEYVLPDAIHLVGASAALTSQDQLYVSAVNAMPLVGAASLLVAAGVAFALYRWERAATASD